MTPTPAVQERLRRYLLGQAGAAEREQLEQELLASDELFEELLVVEDEITDDYLAGRMSVDDRQLFDQYFLKSPERHDKLRFARAFDRATRAHHARATRTSLPGFWSRLPVLYRATAVAALVVILAGIGWMAFRRQRVPTTFATLHLTLSESTRSGDPTQVPKLTLPLTEDAVRIVMDLPAQFPPATHYRVAVETDFGERRFTDPTAQDANSITAVIPAADLRRGQYALILYAVSANGDSQRLHGSYRFNVQ